MLVIEIDGGIHRWRQKYDRKREYYLQNRGFAVIRFSNEKVLKDLPGTLLKIAQVVGNIYAIRETTTEKKYLPSPREEKGRG